MLTIAGYVDTSTQAEDSAQAAPKSCECVRICIYSCFGREPHATLCVPQVLISEP